MKQLHQSIRAKKVHLSRIEMLLENSKLTGLLYCGDTKGKPHLAQGPNSTVMRVEFFVWDRSYAYRYSVDTSELGA
jgi:hypothetical protein